jgi:hypothetical protein
METFTIVSGLGVLAALLAAIGQLHIGLARRVLLAIGVCSVALLVLAIDRVGAVSMSSRGTPADGTIIYLVMMAGMLSQAFLDASPRKRAARRWLFPLLVSPIVFGTLWSQLEQRLTVATATLAYQNGFFWKAIYDSVSAQARGQDNRRHNAAKG